MAARVSTSAARFADGGLFDLYTFAGGPSRTRIGGRRAWLWKAPVDLTANYSVVLTVDATTAGRARLAFTRPPARFAQADRATRFASCAPGTPLFSATGTVGKITGWAGSLITLENRVCLRLHVVTPTESLPLRVPLGTSCPRK